MVLEYVKTYLDDLLVISKDTFLDHLKKLRPVLIKLQEAGLKVNAAKSKFCALETEYLGYSLSREGIAPKTKKIDAILALNPPTKVKELRTFLGMVQYYQDMWKSLCEMLAPLTNLVGNVVQQKLQELKEPKRLLGTGMKLTRVLLTRFKKLNLYGRISTSTYF